MIREVIGPSPLTLPPGGYTTLLLNSGSVDVGVGLVEAYQVE
jgi:hypothetical protein